MKGRGMGLRPQAEEFAMGEFDKEQGGKPGFDKEQQLGDDYSKGKAQQQQDGGKEDFGGKPDFDKGGQQ